MRRLLTAALVCALSVGVGCARGGSDTTRFLVQDSFSRWIGSMDGSGAGYRQVLLANEGSPAATRNGAVIAASAQTGGLTLHDLATNATVHIADGAAQDPTWSGDETQLAFVREGGEAECTMGYDLEIWAVNANGSNERKLLGRPFASYSSPAWSSNGTWLAYGRVERSSTSCGVTEAGLYAIQLSNPAAERLLVRGAGQPSFAPRGTQLAYLVGSGDGRGDVVVANFDGSLSGAHTVLKNVEAARPLWSPDGTQIEIPCMRGGEQPVMCIVTVATGKVRYIRDPQYTPFAWVEPTAAVAFPLGRAAIDLSATVKGRPSCETFEDPNQACFATYRVRIADRGPDAVTGVHLDFKAATGFYPIPGADFLCLIPRGRQLSHYSCGTDETGLSSWTVPAHDSKTFALTVRSPRGAAGALTLTVRGQQFGSASVRLRLPG